MLLYKCKNCNFESSQKNDYSRHLKTKKHINNVQYALKNFICNECNFSTSKKTDYNRHLMTSKHIKKNNVNNDEFTKEEIYNKFQELMNKMGSLENKNDQNTQKIVKEARNIKSSMLTILNTHFKDTVRYLLIPQVLKR